MTNEEKAKAYDEALERARKQRDDYQKELNKADKNSQLAGLLRAGISAIELAFSELAESDDERARRELMEFVNWAASRGSVRNDWLIKKCPEKWVAYLEKMKENPKSADSILSDCVSDVKWADTIITRVIVALSDDVDYNMDEPCKYRREIDDLKKLREVLCGQKEWKPAESISQLTVQGKGVYKICPRCKERMVRDDSMVYTSMPPQYRYECPKCGEMECDTVMYDNPEMEEQKPAEWGEEDENMLWNIISIVGESKSIQADEMLDWLKSLRPSWKPSEEQMEYLAKGIIILGEEGNYKTSGVLNELHNDLKKLL